MNVQKHKKKKVIRRSESRQNFLFFRIFFGKEDVDELVINGAENTFGTAVSWILGIVIKYFTGLYLIPAYIIVKFAIPISIVFHVLSIFKIINNDDQIINTGNKVDFIYAFASIISFAQGMAIRDRVVQLYTIIPVYISVIFYIVNMLFIFSVKHVKRILNFILANHFLLHEVEDSDHEFSSAQRVLMMIGWQPRPKSMLRGIFCTAIIYFLFGGAIFLKSCIEGNFADISSMLFFLILLTIVFFGAMMIVFAFTLLDFTANLLMWRAAAGACS